VYTINRNYQRKKIFKQNSAKAPPGSGAGSNYYTFREAIQKLTQIQESEIAKFVEMVGMVLALLRMAAPHRQSLHKNQSYLFKLLVNENPVDHETRETIVNKNKIINRLRVSKMS
jgi:hypothetical protein